MITLGQLGCILELEYSSPSSRGGCLETNQDAIPVEEVTQRRAILKHLTVKLLSTTPIHIHTLSEKLSPILHQYSLLYQLVVTVYSNNEQ